MLNLTSLGYTLPRREHSHLDDTENNESKGSNLMVWTELCVFGDREREKKGNMTQRAETSELQSGPMQQGQERIQSLWESFTLMVCSGTCSKAAR